MIHGPAPAERVRLVDVDDKVLAALVQAATIDADADDVTPRLEDGANGWTAERVAWLEAYHRRCRANLTLGARERTWAVTAPHDRRVLGAVRLAPESEQPGTVELGIWLTRTSRGRRLGIAAVRATLEHAWTLDAGRVIANTTPGNAAALRLLQRAGFVIDPPSANVVRAYLDRPSVQK